MSMLQQLAEEIKEGRIATRQQLQQRKTELARLFKSAKWPQNSEVLALLDDDAKEHFRKLIQLKPVRTQSGIAAIGVVCMPAPCPHGKCTYCPTYQNVPNAYTGKEPALRRALANAYDPYKQVQNRLRQLYSTGHLPEKCELIVIGGTFTALDKDYQENFIRQSIRAMSEFPAVKEDDGRPLEVIQRENETAKIRCIAEVIETRPDWAMAPHSDMMLKFGATRVELGIQSTYDKVLERTKRGHSVNDSIESTRILKDCGFKLTYHMMPGLPESTPETDLKMFERIFNDSDFKPDSMKIYPTLVVKNSELLFEWRAGKFQPQPIETMVPLMAKIKAMCPPYVRLMRIERDIPGTEIMAGIKATNLRQLIHDYMKENGMQCHCVRCREVGLGEKEPREITLQRINYEASQGQEVFLSFEDVDQNILVGLLRLRNPSKLAHRPEVKDAAIVRELHVYGEQLPVDSKKEAWQHKGYGKQLLEEAERITKEEFGKDKLVVISGVGARPYYFKFGYERDGPYVSKKL